MAEIAASLHPIHELNPTLESLFAALDPKSFILSNRSSSVHVQHKPPLHFPPANLTLQRGFRYKAYAELRESRLRMKHCNQQPDVPASTTTATPPKKKVTFQGMAPVTARNGTSVVARSVPDFSAVLRKENRKPMSMLEMTPPPSKATKGGVLPKLGSRSANAGEKRGGGLTVRKSCATVEELKGFSLAAASAINGENRGRTSRGMTKTVLGYRQY
ncbi:PREDICTED: uncharacterized protein LOC104602447 [Nelumbo nucifera]|uniref:Uncharacterized protein LOC104602447 n=2 Tax=Nelumbo nucifera TaxID=4432 RepID=A0A1U8ANM8_NELNU|nr:PREDICTED: uncharacterized protein LOC104602447 [Nelumbo nucifera]DAD35392.1 TPA_asm: hypothetical protein HUJ06_006032 [Nelumbo nucifera]